MTQRNKDGDTAEMMGAHSMAQRMTGPSIGVDFEMDAEAGIVERAAMAEPVTTPATVGWRKHRAPWFSMAVTAGCIVIVFLCGVAMGARLF